MQAFQLLLMLLCSAVVWGSQTLASAAEPDGATSQGLASFADTQGVERIDSRPAHIHTGTRYQSLPLRFEENKGQTDRQVRFLSRGQGYMMFFTDEEVVFLLRRTPESKPSILRMRMIGADRPSEIAGNRLLATRVNYVSGNDPSRWQGRVPTYEQVVYRDIYRGTDLVFYGNQQRLEYDFVLAAEADPHHIVLAFDGADHLELSPEGDLIIDIGGIVVRQKRPELFQDIDGVRHKVDGRYVVTSNRYVSFSVGAYDKTRRLVIDPVLVYSTYLGGSSGDIGRAIAVDGSGNAYVTGLTASADFPIQHATQTGLVSSAFSVFVTKLSADGSRLLYSTYLGGQSSSQARAIAVDAAGNAYITGRWVRTFRQRRAHSKPRQGHAAVS